ncbi:MAG: reverse transcriptase [Bacteroidales bacterium]|nr:reverse transcriptase [Bacteroidales bacterium]
MKRIGNLWPLICARDNIEKATDQALKSKRLTRNKRRFIENRGKLLDQLEESLKNETYKFGPYHSFVVREPKERRIDHPDVYPDKILHNCVMNVVAPVMYSKFTADTYGSIKGRGIKSAADKLKPVLRDNPNAYYVQIDVRKYYQSINHDVLKGLLRRAIKCAPTLRMLDAIIDSYAPGLAIGVWPNQMFANLTLTPVDHWAKEVAHIPHYFRYMDDIVFLAPDKVTAHKWLANISKQITALKLEIKDNARIAPVACGIDFMGYKFFPTHTMLRKRIKQRMQRRVRTLCKRNVSDEEFKRKTASYFGWCKHANCRNLLRTTFNEKLNLYKPNMEFKRLSQIRDAENWFGLPREKRVSIESLFNADIIFFEHLITTIKNETKVVVKFAFPDSPEDYRYFITRSDVIRDRLERDRDVMPFIATIKKIKNYTAYE